MKNSYIIYSTNQTGQIKQCVRHELYNGFLMLHSRIHLLEHLCPELTQKEQWNLLSTDVAFMEELLNNVFEGYDAHAKLGTFDLLDMIEDACEGFEAALRTKQIALVISSKNDGLPSVTDYYGDYLSLKNCLIRLLTAALELSVNNKNTSTKLASSAESSDKIIPLFEKRAIYVTLEGSDDCAIITISALGNSIDIFENISELQADCSAIAAHGGRLNVTKKGSNTIYTVKLPWE